MHEIICNLRKERGLTQQQLADRVRGKSPLEKEGQMIYNNNGYQCFSVGGIL